MGLCCVFADTLRETKRGQITMSNVTPQDILDTISDEYQDDVTEEEIEAEIKSYEEFEVTDSDQIRRGVLSNLARSLDITKGELTDGENGGNGDQTASLVDIGDIDTDEEWVSLEVEMVEEWDNDTESISQVGLVKDGTGRIRFTSWATSDVPLLVEGEQYRLENVVTDEYEGRMSIKLNSNTEVEPLDEERDFSNDVTVEGALVALQSGSGLIKRCPEDDCTRTLGNDDRCNDHGQVDGEHDLRLKAVLDDGNDVENVIINDDDIIEELTGFTLEESQEMAREALDMTVVADEMEPEILGRYYRVSGARLGDNVVVDSVEQVTDFEDTESLLVRARSM